MNKRVAYIFPTSHRFRAAFHEQLREILAARDIDYQYYYVDADYKGKGDTIAIDWAVKTPAFRLKIGKIALCYQAALLKTWNADLVIIQQENGLLVNYPIQILRRLFGKKTAFFGHGKNFQATDRKSFAESFKKVWINKVDWWFAYTQRSAQTVIEAGFPKEKITVFNNAIDVSSIQRCLDTISDIDVDNERRKFDSSEHIGIYIGGLYAEKRIPFLLEAAKLIRKKCDDFQLIVVGGGEHSALVEEAARQHSWIHAMGPKFDREKAMLAKISKSFLMPGLVGLGVLDSFAYDTPMVTTNLSYHSPEIDYLVHGENGVIVADENSVDEYADAVLRILTDQPWRAQLSAGGKLALREYTIERMVERFAGGVVEALSA